MNEIKSSGDGSVPAFLSRCPGLHPRFAILDGKKRRGARNALRPRGCGLWEGTLGGPEDGFVKNI